MFIGTKSHGKKIVHYVDCYQAKKIKEENVIWFHTMKEARKAGYKLCKCCCPMGKYYRKEKRKIERFALQNSMEIYLQDGALYVETPVAPWKIVVGGQKKKLFLYHGNTEVYRDCEKKDGHIIHTYHWQKRVRHNSILGYMRYIDQHDCWRSGREKAYKALPRQTKGQKKLYKQEKKKAKRLAVLRVHNLIDKMRYERELQCAV